VNGNAYSGVYRLLSERSASADGGTRTRRVLTASSQRAALAQSQRSRIGRSAVSRVGCPGGTRWVKLVLHRNPRLTAERPVHRTGRRAATRRSW
jgi:hypothetical protein